jgi:hypothetical protein
MKTWEKPKLIVLVRGKPEEAVLEGCKWFGTGDGPNTAQNYCLTAPFAVVCNGDSCSFLQPS